MIRIGGASTVHVKGIKRYQKKGVWYTYHRASGTKLERPFGTAAFFEELAKIEEGWKAKQETGAKPGTLGMAIAVYKEKSARYQDLAPRSKDDYGKIFDYLKPLHDMPLGKIDSPFIAKLRDDTNMARKRRFANYVLSVLGVVMAYAREQGHIKGDNPVHGVQKIARPRGMPKANRPWSAIEREVILQSAPGYLQVPIALGMFCGMREGDVVKLPRNARQDGWIKWETNKAGTTAEWPVHPRLAAILDRNRGDTMTMCANSMGQPWRSGNSFRSAFFKLVAKLNADGRVRAGITFHGLRHTVGDLLKEAGFSDEDIAVALGHRTTRMARHYSEGASRRRRMGGVVALFDPLGRKE